MNKPKEQFNLEDWLKIARKDWKRAKRNLKERDLEVVGFFLQQSVEKYLKAFLQLRGWKLRKIHELDALLDEAVKYKPDLQIFYNLCERITGYYFADRYPPLPRFELTKEDIEKDLKEAEKFIRTLFPEEKLNV